jgi:hypothetical protein
MARRVVRPLTKELPSSFCRPHARPFIHRIDNLGLKLATILLKERDGREEPRGAFEDRFSSDYVIPLLKIKAISSSSYRYFFYSAHGNVYALSVKTATRPSTSGVC